MLPNVSRQPPYQPKPSLSSEQPAAQGFLRSCWAVTRLRNHLLGCHSRSSSRQPLRPSNAGPLSVCYWLAFPTYGSPSRDFGDPSPFAPEIPEPAPPLFFFSLSRGEQVPNFRGGWKKNLPLSILVWRALRNMPLLLRITYHRVSGAGLGETRWSRRLWCHAI